MNVTQFLHDAAASHVRRALPILSFPGARQLGIRVDELVKDASLYAKAICYVADNTPSLAAVCPMDLSVEAEAFGAEVRFHAEEVPAVLGQLVTDAEDAESLALPTVEQGRLPVCLEGIRLAKAQIPDKPLFAGMIGPYSLAGRLMDVTEIMYFCFDEPETVHLLLKKVTEFLLTYGAAIKAAGADGIVVAEPLAGVLNPEMALEFSMPYVRQLVDGLQDDSFGIIYHNCGGSVSRMLPEIFRLGSAGYHFGNAVDMASVLREAPADAVCMGNLDPTAAFVQGTVESVTAQTKQLMEACGSYRNFIPSSGCDVPYGADWEKILAFYAAL